MPFECDQKNALWDAWHRSAILYSKAVKEFSDNVGPTVSDDVEFLRVRAEQAKKTAEHTRERYEGHINRHGC